jgi:hypothetical protein
LASVGARSKKEKKRSQRAQPLDAPSQKLQIRMAMVYQARNKAMQTVGTEVE